VSKDLRPSDGSADGYRVGSSTDHVTILFMVLQDLLGEITQQMVLNDQRDSGNCKMLWSRNLAERMEEEPIHCNAQCTNDALRTLLGGSCIIEMNIRTISSRRSTAAAACCNDISME